MKDFILNLNESEMSDTISLFKYNFQLSDALNSHIIMLYKIAKSLGVTINLEKNYLFFWEEIDIGFDFPIVKQIKLTNVITYDCTPKIIKDFLLFHLDKF